MEDHGLTEDPSGRCFKLVKDIEAFFGFLIDSGQEDEIPDIEAAKSTMRVDEKGRPVNTARQDSRLRIWLVQRGLNRNESLMFSDLV